MNSSTHPALRFCSLGSGSSGNAWLIEARGADTGDASSQNAKPTRLLVDCGLGQRQLVNRLARHSLSLQDLSAIFVTHEHSDHIGCVPRLAESLRIPVWMSHGTWQAIGEPVWPEPVRLARDHCPIALSEHCELLPFTVPHDAREPLQLVVASGQRRMGICTDLGHASSHVVESLQSCHALVLESNHDPELLAASRYPPFLKRRVGGAQGHLSNAAAAELLRQVAHAELRLLVAAHLSEQNNRPDLALQHMGQVLQDLNLPTELLVADASHGCDWQVV